MDKRIDVRQPIILGIKIATYKIVAVKKALSTDIINEQIKGDLNE